MIDSTAAIEAAQQTQRLLMRLFLFLTLVACAPLPCTAQKQATRAIDIKTLSFISSEGLQLKLPAGSRAVALPAPPSQSPEGTAANERLYPSSALWLHDETRASWSDSIGNMLMVAAISMMPPSAPGKLVRRGDYEAAMNASRRSTWDAQALTQWMSIFSRVKGIKPPVKLEGFRNLKEVYEFELHSPDSNAIAYAFRMDSSAGQKWYMALFMFHPGFDVDRSREEFRGQFLPSLEITRSGKRKSSQNVKSNSGITSTKGDRFTDARQQAIESISHMDKWWYINASHFIILSDFKDRKMPKELEKELELLRTTFRKIAPPRVQMNQIGVVRIFKDREDYIAYTPRNAINSVGLWLPATKELLISGSPWLGTGPTKDHLKRVIYHEAFHQYSFYALNALNGQIWYEEGFAEFCGGFHFDRQRMSVLEQEDLIPYLHRVLESKRLDLKNLTTMSQKQFYSSGATSPVENYAIAWGLVYFCEKGVEGADKISYGRLMATYRNALWNTKDPAKAHEQAFRHVRFEALEKAYTEFWNSPDQRRKAERRDTINSMRR